MRAWTTAEVDGSCSYCDTRYKGGERVYAVQGEGWRKVYGVCCATPRQGAPEDTGEVLDVTDQPRYPPTLRAEAMRRLGDVETGFDHAKAAANDKD